MNATMNRESGIRSGAREDVVPVALVLVLTFVLPGPVHGVDAAEPEPIFEDGFDVSGVSPRSTAVGLPTGARLDVYPDTLVTLRATEIIKVVYGDFAPSANIAVAVSGYAKVPAPGSWQRVRSCSSRFGTTPAASPLCGARTSRWRGNGTPTHGCLSRRESLPLSFESAFRVAPLKAGQPVVMCPPVRPSGCSTARSRIT